MKVLNYLATAGFLLCLVGCNKRGPEKGFYISETKEEQANEDGISNNSNDTATFKTQPNSVLSTGMQSIRITPVFKVNKNTKNNQHYTGSNNFLYNYESASHELGNNWNYNFMPGFHGVYGFNIVNLMYYNYIENKQKPFFKKPVLVKTVYYPSTTADTLNKIPVLRNYFMISAYDEDTNGDSIINQKDLRRFYLFDSMANFTKPLIPKNYGVFKSSYDRANDHMQVFAKLDSNGNGMIDDLEPIHIFWIDLKNPERTGKMYGQ